MWISQLINVWQDSFMCDRTHLNRIAHDSWVVPHMWKRLMSQIHFIHWISEQVPHTYETHESHDFSYMCGTRLMSLVQCHTCMRTSATHVWDSWVVPHMWIRATHVWYNSSVVSFTRATRLIHMCGTTHACVTHLIYVWQNSFVCNTIRSYSWRDT